MNKFLLVLLSLVTAGCGLVVGAQNIAAEAATTSTTPTTTTVSEKKTKVRGISLSPAFTEIGLNTSYDLKVSNSDVVNQRVEVRPALFKVSEDSKSLTLLSPEEIAVNNASDFVSISQISAEIAAGGSFTTKVTYLKEPKEFFAGVLVGLGQSDSGQVPLRGQLASIITRTNLEISEVNSLGSSLSVTPVLQVGFISLGDTYKLETVLNNTSSKILKPSGNIKVSIQNKYVNSVALTAQLDTTVLPKASASVTTEFVDPRPFWERIGSYTYTQTIELITPSGIRQLTQTRTVTSVPWQVIVIAILALILLAVMVQVLRKTAFKPKFERSRFFGGESI